MFCIPKSFNTNISHQLFDDKQKITFVNTQHENTNSKGDLVLRFKVRFLVFKTKFESKIYINTALMVDKD